MVISSVDSSIVSTRKRRHQNWRLQSKLSEYDTEFLIGQTNYEVQFENRTNTVREGITSIKTNSPAKVNDSQVNFLPLANALVIKVRTEVDSVLTTFETLVQDAILTGIESVVSVRMKLAKRLGNCSSGQNVDNFVQDPTQIKFSVTMEGLQITASSKLFSNIDSSKIDETRGIIAAE